MFKKSITTLLVLAMVVVLAFPSFASVGYRVDGVPVGQITAIDYKGTGSRTGGQVTFDGSRATFNLLSAGLGPDGITSMTTTDEAVPITDGFVRKAIANDANDEYLTGTLANGEEGQLLTVYITAQPGSKVFKVTPTTSTVIEEVWFDALHDSCTFLYINDTTGWVVWNSNSVEVIFALP